MADYTELKRLAEAATQCSGPRRVETDCNGVYQVVGDGSWKILNAWHTPDGKGLENAKFTAAASPSSVLALIAENEELGRYLCTCRDCGGEGALHTGDWHSYGHMDPPEPVMEKCGECDGTGLLGEIQDLYQVITERDQLRAEVAGLKTGYEAYERVNAELKAEVEALRKDKDRLDALESNFWDVRHDSHPIADTGDSSSSLEIVGHWMDKPFERVIGEDWNENLRAAIDQAMKAPAYPPARPEYPELDDIPDFTPGNGNSARRRAESLGIDYDAAMRKGSQS